MPANESDRGSDSDVDNGKEERKVNRCRGNKRVRRDFSVEDNELIHRHLGVFITTECKLVKSEVERHLAEVSELKDLVTRYGVSGLIVKIRTERKKRLKSKI